MTVVRDRKIGTALRTNQIVGFVTVPAWGCIKRQRRIECVSESLLEEGEKEGLTVLMVRDKEPWAWLIHSTYTLRPSPGYSLTSAPIAPMLEKQPALLCSIPLSIFFLFAQTWTARVLLNPVHKEEYDWLLFARAIHPLSDVIKETENSVTTRIFAKITSMLKMGITWSL